MQLEANEIQIWSINLAITPEQENEKLALLNQEEIDRAKRFHFPIHRQRFISARSTLRQILSLYLNLAPQDITLLYTEHKKPYLSAANSTQLNFNLAHSHDIAVYAFTLNHHVGVDIEKIKYDYNHAVAERYFSLQENENLNRLPEAEQVQGFYRIWTRKEAIVKAVGKGLFIPLSSFSVSVKGESEIILLENESWTLLPLSIHSDYQSALASNQIIKSISYWSFFNQTSKLEKRFRY